MPKRDCAKIHPPAPASSCLIDGVGGRGRDHECSMSMMMEWRGRERVDGWVDVDDQSFLHPMSTQTDTPIHNDNNNNDNPLTHPRTHLRRRRQGRSAGGGPLLDAGPQPGPVLLLLLLLSPCRVLPLPLPFPLPLPPRHLGLDRRPGVCQRWSGGWGWNLLGARVWGGVGRWFGYWGGGGD